MTKPRRDYDSELAELVTLCRRHGVLVESIVKSHSQTIDEGTTTLTWVTDQSGDGEMRDADP